MGEAHCRSGAQIELAVIGNGVSLTPIPLSSNVRDVVRRLK
jgi:hypothetical protein